MATSFKEAPLPAWNLMLPKNQEFWVNHLDQIPITANKQGVHEKKCEVLFSAGAQDLKTSGYEWSGLSFFDFSWANSQLKVVVVFAPKFDPPFSPAAFDDLVILGLGENPFLLDED